MTRLIDSRGLARLIAFAVFLLATPALPAFSAAIGLVIAIGGSPEATGPGGNRGLQPGSEVYEGDKITTGYGNAQIIFVDETKLVVGPNSTLVIDRFLLRGDKRASLVSIDALRGTFRFISGKSDKDAYKIETTNATIGIRGTAFDFSSKMTTVVAMFRGHTVLSTGGDAVELGPHCDVGRAAFGRADPYDGRAAGVLIKNNLPYVVDQSSLNPSFRLDTSDCGPKVGLLEDGRRHNNFSPGPPGRSGSGGGLGEGGGCEGEGCGGGIFGSGGIFNGGGEGGGGGGSGGDGPPAGGDIPGGNQDTGGSGDPGSPGSPGLPGGGNAPGGTGPGPGPDGGPGSGSEEGGGGTIGRGSLVN
ncbi:MAG: FecR domain-containing protein [Parvibaculaceae bacterium]